MIVGMALTPDGPEWTRYYRAVSGVTALHARFVAHRYPRHAHEYSVVGLIESGVQSYTYRGSRHITPAGRVFVVNPDEPHTGEPASPVGYVYRTLYLQRAFLARALGEFREPAPRSVQLRGAVLDDPLVARSLSAFHRALERGATTLEQESLLLQAVVLLLTCYGDSSTACSTRPTGKEPGPVSTACDYMEAHFDHDVSLSSLAQIVRLSPWYFARVFEKATGLPPHAYLEGVRIRKACALLDRGETIVEAALAAGYADQSHMTKRFRRFLGITPRQYLRERLLGVADRS
jgi:AraC-like DNA-binding protein